MRGKRLQLWAPVVLIGGPIAAFIVWALFDNARQFVSTFLNGVTLAALYFLVASGFTLVFGLMRNVNLAHGSLYLLGAYVGWEAGGATDSWLLAVAGGLFPAAFVGGPPPGWLFPLIQGKDLPPTTGTLGLSSVLAGLLLVV